MGRRLVVLEMFFISLRRFGSFSGPLKLLLFINGGPQHYVNEFYANRYLTGIKVKETQFAKHLSILPILPTG